MNCRSTPAKTAHGQALSALRLPGRLCPVLGLIGITFITGFPGRTLSQNLLRPPTTTLQLLAQSDGSVSVKVGKRLITQAELKGQPSPISVENASISRTAAGDGLQIRASEGQVLLRTEPALGWSALLESGNQTTCDFAQGGHSVHLAAAQTNPQAIRLSLPDGGTAEVTAGRILHLDLFSDGTYLASASGPVAAKSADGQESTLDLSLPPMSGGPLIRTLRDSGQPRLKRSSPTLSAQFAGDSHQNLKLIVAGRSFDIQAQRRQLDFPNGASLTLERTPEHGAIQWRVERGDFLFTVAGLAGWKARSWTATAAAMTWDSTNQAVDLKNLSQAAILVVSLPGYASARVGTGATLQFLRLDEATFATSASGGPVDLYDALTRQHSQLGQGQLLMETPSAARPGRQPFPDAVTLSRPEPEVTIVSGLGQTIELRADEEAVLQNDDGDGLRFRLSGRQDQLQVKALHGDHVFCPNPEGNVTIELPEQQEVIWYLSRREGFLQAQAMPENTSPVRISVGAGSTLLLRPGEQLLLLVAGPGLPGGIHAGAVYSEKLEPAGRPDQVGRWGFEPGKTGGSWLFGRDPGEIYGPRIPQPPVSIVR